MTDEERQALQRRVKRLEARYRLRFAGKSRLTRNLELVDELIDEARSIFDDAAALGSAGAAIVQDVAQKLALYEEEHSNIVDAKAHGETAIKAAVAGARLGFIKGRYTRNFAGQSRASRDLSELDDVIGQLEDLENVLRTVSDDETGRLTLNDARGQLEMYEEERRLIEDAQDGRDRRERAMRQLRTYKSRFWGRSRLACRPERLRYVIERIDEVRREMVRDALERKAAPKIDEISEHIIALSEELAAMESLHTGTDGPAHAEALNAEVGLLRAGYQKSYAGKNRASCEVDELARLADQLADVEVLLTELAPQVAEARSPLDLARDLLTMFADEYGLIIKARKTQSAS